MRHFPVRAAIVSGFVVRALDIAAAVNRGRQGNLDLPLIRTLARDLGQDVNRAREYARVRYLKPAVTISPALPSSSPPTRLSARPLDVTLSFVTSTPLLISPVSSAKPSTASSAPLSRVVLSAGPDGM